MAYTPIDRTQVERRGYAPLPRGEKTEASPAMASFLLGTPEAEPTPTPFRAVAGSRETFFSPSPEGVDIRDVLREIFVGAGQETARKIFVGEPTRFLFGTALSLAPKAVRESIGAIEPKELGVLAKIGKIERPIGRVQDELVKDLIDVGLSAEKAKAIISAPQRFLQRIGASPEVAEGVTSVPFAVLGLLFADPRFGGLRKNKNLVTVLREIDDVEDAFAVLKKAGVPDDLARAYGKTFAATKSEGEIQSGLDALDTALKTTKAKVGALPTTREAAGAERRMALETVRVGAVARVGERAERAIRAEELSGFRKVIRERFAFDRERIALKNTTRRAVQVLKNKAIGVEEGKKAIVAYAKSHLPPALRGKFLSAVATAKTRGGVAQAIRGINVARNKEMKKEIVSSISEAMADATSLPPRSQERMAEVLAPYTSRRFTEKTKAKLRDLRSFTESTPEAIPRFGPRTLKALEKSFELDKQGLADVPLRDLIRLQKRVENIFEEGTLSGRLTAETKQLRVENALKEIAESNPRNLDAGIPPPPKPGDPKIKGFEGAYNDFREGLRKHVFNFFSPDVGFMALDNDTWFGTLWRTFKAPMDEAAELAQEARDTVIDDLFKRIKAIETRWGKLEPENYERVMLHATLQQVGGRSKLQKTDPRLYTDSFLDSVRLNEGEMAFYRLGREIFDQLRPYIAQTLELTRGEQLGRVDNYWSWITDFDDSQELFSRLKGDFTTRSRTEQGFTVPRTLGRQKINPNALDVLVKHITDATQFIYYEEKLNHLSRIAKADEFRKSVGAMGQKWVAGWLDLLARGGIPKGYKPGFLTQFVHNVGHGILGFKLSPIVKQPLAMITAVGTVGKSAPGSYLEFLTNPALRKGVHIISKQQKFRSFDDPAYVALAKSERLKWWQEKGYRGIKEADSWTADTVWYAAYRKRAEELGVPFSRNGFIAGEHDARAVEYADLVTRRTQGSAHFKDAPLVYATEANRDVVMAFLQFQRFVHNQALLWRDAKVALLKESDPIKAAALASSLLAAGIAESYITTGIAQVFGSQSYADKEKEEALGHRVLDAVITNVPVISNIKSVAEYGGTGIGAWDVFRQGLRGLQQAFTAKKPETRLRGAIGAGATVGILAGIPGSSQASQILRGLVPEPRKKRETFPKLPELPKLPKLPKL